MMEQSDRAEVVETFRSLWHQQIHGVELDSHEIEDGGVRFRALLDDPFFGYVRGSHFIGWSEITKAIENPKRLHSLKELAAEDLVEQAEEVEEDPILTIDDDDRVHFVSDFSDDDR